MRRHLAPAAAVVALLALAGCGSASGSGGGTDDPTPSGGGTKSVAARDKGPVCVGTAAADGLHVLRGGGYKLPGGGAVRYEAAQSDGTTRTATLREGATYQDGQRSQSVKPGQQVTYAGHAFTVSQICSYRVVLEPKDAADRTAAAAAPVSMKSVGGAADSGLCFTTNAAVRAAAAKGFPPKGGSLTLIDNGGLKVFPTGWSVVALSVDPAAGTARFTANCAAVPVADYQDAAVGDPVELAGVEFTVGKVSGKVVTLTRTSA
ncbi:hypothetical protein [Streptomyces sp. SPB162]|uniref:hypothetical protein n=1 Tax=Streptomyces sp. SPB162 TaxID=2940560 RepID=UPI002404C1D2|nr:hypothetical protein [Streptomyces sp. SPB162]MDF9815264.1 hypothetical protein [Streptomyces sp. SPB162]